MVVDRHPATATAADGEPLQESRALTGRALGPVGAVGLGVGGQQLLVELEGLPSYIARVCPGNERSPLVAVQFLYAELAVRALALA